MNAQRKEDLYAATPQPYPTTPLHVNISSQLKKQAETILQKRGIPVFAAIEYFYSEIIRCGGLPGPNQPEKEPLYVDEMTPEELGAAIQQGMDEIKAGNYFTAEEINAFFSRDYYDI